MFSTTAYFGLDVWLVRLQPAFAELITSVRLDLELHYGRLDPAWFEMYGLGMQKHLPSFRRIHATTTLVDYPSEIPGRLLARIEERKEIIKRKLSSANERVEITLTREKKRRW
jgi:hypothetical protein